MLLKKKYFLFSFLTFCELKHLNNKNKNQTSFLFVVVSEHKKRSLWR